VFKQRQHDPQASMLDIKPEELQFIDQLAPLLDRSPRALKRFVNVYRLLKASLPPAEQDTFLEQSAPLGGDYRAALLLLAIVNGLPTLSDALFDRLLGSPARAANNGTGTFGGILTGLPTSGAATDETACLSRWLRANLGQGWEDIDASVLLSWVPRVARYSYHFH
jgi:hypothetical protein